MSAISERAIKFLFCRGNESHKYVDLNIRKDELYSNGISDKVNIEKTEAVDLLTGKFNFDGLVLCENFNLHYYHEPFLVK